MSTAMNDKRMHLEDSPVARMLFGDVRLAWFWLILRLYIGWQWLHAGWGKVTNSAWVGSDAGKSISGFVQGALNQTTGAHPNVQGWYASFLKNVVLAYPTLWSYLVSFGELLVGIALILGLFTGIAAFFGAVMNESYLLAGAVSINPILFPIAILLILAWRTAGWWGFDRWALPALGTPWSPGRVFRKTPEAE